MRIRRIRVQNLRAVKDCTLTLDDLTVLVGPNGAGKSTFLHALTLFQGDRAARMSDYRNGDTSQEIRIQVTFDPSNSATGAFSTYTRNGMLAIARIIRWKDGQSVSTLHGCPPGNPDFKDVLGEIDGRVTIRKYAALIKKPKYSRFPKLRSVASVRGHLLAWERDNPDECDLCYDDKELTGNSASGAGLLSAHIQFLHIPAVRDAATAENGRPVLSESLNAAAQRDIAKKAKLRDSKTMTKAVCDAIMWGKDLPELDRLRAEADKTLGAFMRGAGLGLEWMRPNRDDCLPRAEPHLIEDGYRSPVDMAGHGLQRALVMVAALLGTPLPEQAGTAPADGPREGPSFVLAIEEPELYQHPTRMRHLANLLRSLPRGGLDGVADHIQVVYTTHSPHFAPADRIGDIRLVSKDCGKGDRPMETRVGATTSVRVLDDLKRCGEAASTDNAVDYSLLRAMAPNTSEGFFADAVVLTAGPSDRIALLGVAEVMGHSLDVLGVSVISCGSKLAIPLPLVMFRRLGIPVYAVWDADLNEGAQRKESERILSVLGHAGAEWRGKVNGSFACLATNLEDAINEDLKKALGQGVGERPYDDIIARRRALHRLAESDSKPLRTHLVVEEVVEKKLHLETLESIVGQIIKLVGGGAPT